MNDRAIKWRGGQKLQRCAKFSLYEIVSAANCPVYVPYEKKSTQQQQKSVFYGNVLVWQSCCPSDFTASLEEPKTKLSPLSSVDVNLVSRSNTRASSSLVVVNLRKLITQQHWCEDCEGRTRLCVHLLASNPSSVLFRRLRKTLFCFNLPKRLRYFAAARTREVSKFEGIAKAPGKFFWLFRRLGDKRLYVSVLWL